jgi:hypothetical protein
VLAHDALRALDAVGRQHGLFLVAALDEALRLETLQHLSGRGTRDAEHLGDAGGDRRGSRRRAILADREGEEIDRLQILVHGMSVRLRHRRPV